jgi:hypothetical protein
MSTSAIEWMSWEEKLRALEELWDAITREGGRYESPAWHEQELMETQQRHQSGAEQPMDCGLTPSANSVYKLHRTAPGRPYVSRSTETLPTDSPSRFASTIDAE